MKSLEKQLEEFIIDNTPKNIDLRIPLSKDVELKEVLQKLSSQVNIINNKVNIIEAELIRFIREEEQRKWEQIYRGKF